MAWFGLACLKNGTDEAWIACMIRYGVSIGPTAAVLLCSKLSLRDFQELAALH
jgi:hypothetical protein